MGNITLTATGANAPFFPNDWSLENVTTVAFDPITTLHDADYVHPAEMPVPYMVHKYARKGFLVRPNADGALYAISKARYDKVANRNMTLPEKQTALAALVPQKFNGVLGQWIEIPIVKVFSKAGVGGLYVTAASEVEIGMIL